MVEDRWTSYVKRIVTFIVTVVTVLCFTGCWLFINRENYEARALAIFEAGENFYQRGDYDKAVSTFTEVIESYPRSQLVDDAYYLVSLSFARMMDWEHAVGAAQKLETQFPQSPLVPRVQIVLAQGYQHLELFVPSLTAYFEVYLHSNNPTERATAAEQGKNLLGREQDYETLTDLFDNYRDTEVAEWILYRLGTRAFELEKYDEAEAYYSELRHRFPQSPYIDRIGGKEIAAAALKGKLVIGILLPLSGSFVSYGNKVKNGIELAHSLKPGKNIHLEYYDTQSSPSRAAAGAEHLVRMGAKVIVGPLTSNEAESAITVASRSGTVMISPTSTDPSLLGLYPCLFQLNSFAEEETKAIARYAVSQGLTNFGVLYPQTDQGRNLANLFSSTVTSLGGKVLYNYALTDTVVEMKQTFLDIRHKGAQAVFVPFDRQQLLSVVPQIAYYRMKVRILGIDDFAEEEILRSGDTPFDGAWFAAPPGKYMGTARLESFYNHYKRVHGVEPDWAATLGYDSYNFIYDALTEGKNLSLCQALRNLDDRRGILGRLIYSSDSRNPAVNIYIISNNDFKELQ